MSANDIRREQPLSKQTPTDLLDSILPGLSSVTLADAAKTSESIDTVRFGLNPWYPIHNHTLQGYTFGVQIYRIDRMCLIPLRTWKVPVIEPRTGGFAVGSFDASGGAFPSGSVGSKVSTRLQFPRESAEKLIAAYGAESHQNIGFTVLESLTADTDALKAESILLFRAIMATPINVDWIIGETLKGTDMWLEALPRWLKEVTPKLLDQAMREGVGLYRGDGTANSESDGLARVYKFRHQAFDKGMRMIEEIGRAVAAATDRALNENTGILQVTKTEMIAASRGAKDKKNQTDKLDNWLLTQFPSFRLDTDVERALASTNAVTKAIEASGTENATSLRALLELQRETLLQLQEERKVNNELMKQLLAGQAQAPAGGASAVPA